MTRLVQSWVQNNSFQKSNILFSLISWNEIVLFVIEYHILANVILWTIESACLLVDLLRNLTRTHPSQCNALTMCNHAHCESAHYLLDHLITSLLARVGDNASVPNAQRAQSRGLAPRLLVFNNILYFSQMLYSPLLIQDCLFFAELTLRKLLRGKWKLSNRPRSLSPNISPSTKYISKHRNIFKHQKFTPGPFYVSMLQQIT